MKKLPAVAQVRVSLNDGVTILDLKANNSVSLAQLRQIVKNNGFVSKDATVVARGTPAADNKSFIVSGTDEQLLLTSPPRKSGDDWQFVVPAPDKR